MSISLKKLKKRQLVVEEKLIKKFDRFDGLSEEEVKKNTLEDILEDDLDLVFVGINPSLMAAHTRRYYAGPGNHFYKLLYESKLIPEPIAYEEDNRLLQYKIGLTNIVARATRSSADLSKSEIKKGAMIIKEKLKRFKPKIAIFNGKLIYEEFVDKFDKSSFCFGLQPHRIGDTALWVVPSSSARCANFPRMQDKLHFYTSLKKYLAFLKNEIREININEFCFEGKCKQAIPSTSKMWRRKGISAFANGGRIVNKETICMNTSEENILAVPQSTEFIVTNLNTKENSKLEKDSGISSSQSDNSQELSENNKVKTIKNNFNRSNILQQTHRQQNTKFIEQKLKNKISLNLSNQAKNETNNFITIIKERVNNKKLSANKYEEKDFKGDMLFSQVDKNVKRLKFSKLHLNKLKNNSEVTTLDNIE